MIITICVGFGLSRTSTINSLHPKHSLQSTTTSDPENDLLDDNTVDWPKEIVHSERKMSSTIEDNERWSEQDDVVSENDQALSQEHEAWGYSSSQESEEDFKTHRHHIRDLCDELWPSKNHSIERIRGGGCHKITGITVTHEHRGEDSTQEQLILREPREGISVDEFRREVATHRYVQQHTCIPVAEIKSVGYDEDNNTLERCYVILSRIPGRDLNHFGDGKYPKGLTHQQQVSVARDLAKILLQSQETSSLMMGCISAIDNEDGSQTFEVSPSHDDGKKIVKVVLHNASRAIQVSPTKPTLDLLRSQSRIWDYEGFRYKEKLFAVAKEMDAAGYLGGNRYTLYHPDVIHSPPNIMANLSSDGSLNISGILDWDGAIFQPWFYGCELPNWIWGAEYRWDKFGNVIDDMPATAEQREIKRIFVDTIGPKWLRQATEPAYGLARQLIYWIQNGIWSPDQKMRVEPFLKNWESIRPSAKQKAGGSPRENTNPRPRERKLSYRK